MQRNTSGSFDAVSNAAGSRRRAIALMLGASRWLAAAPATAISHPPIRMAVSESLMSDVNLNDARAAMLVWIKRIVQEMSLPVDYNPNVFTTSQQVLSSVREGRVDAVALNILEYRQIADLLDPSQIVIHDDGARPEYLLVVKRDGGIRKLGELRGRRLFMQKSPRMCIANDWLSSILAGENLDTYDKHFGEITTYSKPLKVVLPVFFGQAEAGLLTRHGFTTMCELNPQLSRQLAVLATSPEMVTSLYVFRKNYRGPHRDSLLRAMLHLSGSLSGRQLMAMFRFENLVVKDASCLAGALKVIEFSERARGKHGAGSRRS